MSSVKVRHLLTRLASVEDFLVPRDWRQLSLWKLAMSGEGYVLTLSSIFDQWSSGVYENADVAFTSAPTVWWGLRPLWGNDCLFRLAVFTENLLRNICSDDKVELSWPVRLFAALTLSPQQFARSARPKQDGPDTKRGAKHWSGQQVSIHCAARMNTDSSRSSSLLRGDLSPL